MQYSVRSYFPARGARNLSSTSCPGISSFSGTTSAPAALAPLASALLAVTGTALSPFSLSASLMTVAAFAGLAPSAPASSSRC